MENENKKVCPSCGTENENDYKYCKSCGYILPEVKQDNNFDVNNSYQSTSANANAYQWYSHAQSGANFSGISAQRMAAFVGPNCEKILPKFFTMELSQKRSSWCWSVVALSIAFGVMGASIWFFYRKMYKVGLIVLVISAVLATIQFGLMDSVYSNYMDQIPQDYEQYAADDYYNGAISGIPEYGANDFTDDYFVSEEDLLRSSLNSVINIVCFSGYVVMAVFALGIYKKHAEKKIKALNISEDDPNWLFVLSSKGGTNAGIAVLVSVLIFVFQIVMMGIFMF